jgi:hypothetical protein
MLYELRHYDANGFGALSQLIGRYGDQVLPIWDKYGIEPVGFWTVSVGSPIPRLTYLLPWEDLATRQRVWDQFTDDEDWKRIKLDDSTAGIRPVHTITSSILKPTPGSPLPRRGNQPKRIAGGAFELRNYTFTDTEDLASAVDLFGEIIVPQFEKHGFHVMGLWTTYIGVSPRLTYMVIFENFGHREQAWASFYTDPMWQTIYERLHPGGRPLISQVDNCLMSGTPFSGWR